MKKNEMMSYVNMVCENEGYADSPAYDLIFDQCCKGTWLSQGGRSQVLSCC